ncbi:MAG: hypothetical protein ACETWR_17970, partial [Anaerolineae bacterium]
MRHEVALKSVTADNNQDVTQCSAIGTLPRRATGAPFVDREIVGKYLLGYDIIRVEAKDRIGTADRERIKQASSRLIGLEIVEEDYAKIVMKCLLE